VAAPELGVHHHRGEFDRSAVVAHVAPLRTVAPGEGRESGVAEGGLSWETVVPCIPATEGQR